MWILRCVSLVVLLLPVGGWLDKAALLALGGGFDLGYVKSLGAQGQTLIHKYIEEGGAYLGLCAGGYFGSSYVEFDKGGPLEVCGERQLQFYPGRVFEKTL